MVGLIAMAGVAFVWLWLFAPDSVPDRPRKTLMALAVVVLVSTSWSTVQMMEAHRQARLEAKVRLQRVERKQREFGELIRRENETLGYSSPAGRN